MSYSVSGLVGNVMVSAKTCQPEIDKKRFSGRMFNMVWFIAWYLEKTPCFM